MSLATGLFRSAGRELSRFDRSGIVPVSGLVAAFPVVAFFAIGLQWWGVQSAVTLTLGAHLVAIASKVRTTRTPYGLLVLDVVVLGVATLIGSLTEPVEWSHIVMLAVIALAGGLLV
jgi:hypothetical protein